MERAVGKKTPLSMWTLCVVEADLLECATQLHYFQRTFSSLALLFVKGDIHYFRYFFVSFFEPPEVTITEP
jgi:hypothetical protein